MLNYQDWKKARPCTIVPNRRRKTVDCNKKMDTKEGADEVDFKRTSEEVEEEELDPRVQSELERLNKCTDEINKLELQLEEANAVFRTLLSDSTQQLKATSAKIGNCIEKARPYYEALEVSQKAQKECQSAATHYQRASGVHAAAKETIALAEERFLSNSSDWSFDNAWQEMLNHATMKVMEAEKAKTDSEAEHQRRALAFTTAETEVQRLEKKLKKFIEKSRPYFEQKDALNRALESQKTCVHLYQEKVKLVKADYARSLRALEEISESIHARRKHRICMKQQRQPGVGSEHLSQQELEFDLGSVHQESSSVDGDSCSRSVSGQSNSLANSVENVSEIMEKTSL